MRVPASSRLGALGPVRNRRRGAENHRRALADAVRAEIEGHGDVGERPIERILLALLHMGHAQARRQRRQPNGGEDLVRLQVVLALKIAVRRDEEILEPQARARCPPASLSSTVASNATSTVAAVDGWTIAQG